MNFLILLLLVLCFRYVLLQRNVAQERHDFSGSTNPAEMYGPQKLKSDYKPLPWKDKFPRYDANITEILELHKLTEKKPEFEPILTRKQEKGVDNRVPELIRPVQVRCPKGWTPWGPLCMAEVSLGPRTECFGDLGRFVSSASGTIPKQSSLYPGNFAKYSFWLTVINLLILNIIYFLFIKNRNLPGKKRSRTFFSMSSRNET